MQPPQNPYNQPGFGQQQQPFSPQQPYAPAPQGPRGTVSLDVIGEAWKLVSSNMGTWIGAAAIYLVVGLIINVLQRSAQGTTPNGFPRNTPMSLLIGLIGLFVTQYFVGGLMRMALTTVKGGKAELSELFSAGNFVLSLVIAAIITIIGCFIGFALCIIPGLILAIALSLVTPIIVDGRSGVFGAFGQSWNAMMPNLGSAFVLFLVLGLILLVSLIPFGLGLLATLPLLQVSIALVYRNLFGVAGATAQNTGYTPPPIANPNF